MCVYIFKESYKCFKKNIRNEHKVVFCFVLLLSNLGGKKKGYRTGFLDGNGPAATEQRDVYWTR